MSQGIMSRTARSGARRVGVLGITCTAALLTLQPVLMPFAARAEDGNGNYNGGYATNVNAAQGKITAGTTVKVRLLDPISSSTAQVGDRFRVAVASDDSSGLPSGTVFYGQVAQVHPGTPNSAGSVTLQLALPRGSEAFDQYDSGNSNAAAGGYTQDSAPNNGPNPNYGVPPGGNNGGNGGPNDNYTPAPNTPAANSAYNGPDADGSPSYGNPGAGGPPPSNPVTISNDASATFSGHTPKSAGHTAGIAAAAGALLGFARKRKLGDAIEGGAIGGVGGAAYDQSQKRGASDIAFKRGDEITVRLNRPMAVRTIVVPADEG